MTDDPTLNVSDDNALNVSDDNAVIRDLRAKADEAAALRKELEEMRAAQAEAARKQALDTQITSLGIPAERKEAFARLADKFIEGDPTAEALRGLADEYGFASQPDPVQQQAVAQQQAAQLHRTPTVAAANPIQGTAGSFTQKISDIMARAQAGDPTVGAAQVLELIRENPDLELQGEIAMNTGAGMQIPVTRPS